MQLKKKYEKFLFEVLLLRVGVEDFPRKFWVGSPANLTENSILTAPQSLLDSLATFCTQPPTSKISDSPLFDFDFNYDPCDGSMQCSTQLSL